MRIFYDRQKSILNYCRDKVALDLGCAQHRMMGKEVKEENWLHYRIKKVCKTLIGIDYLEDEVDRLNKLGYNVIKGNVVYIHTIKLPKYKYDVVVCGELLEHLSNPGLFLDNIKKIMSKKTLLIITTPNVYSRQRIKLMLTKKYEKDWLNKEHKAWYSYETLKQLLIHHNFLEVEWGYYTPLINQNSDIISKIKKMIKKKINYKYCNYIELEDGLFFVSKVNNET